MTATHSLKPSLECINPGRCKADCSVRLFELGFDDFGNDIKGITSLV